MEAVLRTSGVFHNHLLGLLNAFMNFSGVLIFSFITKISSTGAAETDLVGRSLSLLTYSRLWYFLLFFLRGKLTFALEGYTLLNLIFLFFCSVVMI